MKIRSTRPKQHGRNWHEQPPTYDEAITRGLDYLKVSDSLAIGIGGAFGGQRPTNQAVSAATAATAWFTYAQAIRGSEPPAIPSEGEE
jgi:hypothetical protein